ncbi:MAG TPA: hypothetical protein VJB02_04405 [Coxiellaceae bacterium]|nr:hypothetical protein [Coxiellaceae bacterium]
MGAIADIYELREDSSDLFIQDALTDRIEQAESLARFSLYEPISEAVNNDVINYLTVLCRLLKEAKLLNQKLDERRTRNDGVDYSPFTK